MCRKRAFLCFSLLVNSVIYLFTHLLIYLFLPFFWKEMEYSLIDMYAKRVKRITSRNMKLDEGNEETVMEIIRINILCVALSTE